MKDKININKKIDISNVNLKKIDFDIKDNIICMLDIIKFIKSNNMLFDISFYYRKHYYKKDKYCFTITYEYKDICTLKYCKNYTYILIEYIKQYFKNFEYDYDSTINCPIIDVII